MTEHHASADNHSQRSQPEAEVRRPTPVRIRSEELFQGHVEVLIAHGTETYRLRRTRSGKLILHK